MATFADLKLTHRIFLKNYPFARFAVKDGPCAKLAKPISECRIALITTAGLMLPGDKRFNSGFSLGDPTFREVPNNADVQGLVEDHHSDSFDHAGIEADKNLALPLDRFQELDEEGTIGSLNHRHFSFMGSIFSPRRLTEEYAPRAARFLREDAVDAVFLTPV